MLSKLALRNARRSMKDYSIYLLTVTISFSLMYAFNMVFFSEDIKSLNQMLETLPLAIGFFSVIVVAVIEWLVHYMNRFMLEKRSRELGTYLLLGISSRKISKMVMMENMIMGSFALLAGFLFGGFLYQILTLIIMNLFQVKYSVKADFSLPAVLLTLLYVILIYAFSMFRLRRRLKKMKICDLIYAEKQNETAIISQKRTHWIFCIVSILLLVFGCGIFYLVSRDTSYFSAVLLLVSIVLIIGGLYGAYITLAALLVKIFLGKNRRKYSKDHLFIYRNLSAKLKTMSFTIGTLSMLLMLTLACIQCAMLFNKHFELVAAESCPFDVIVTAENPSSFTTVTKHFEETKGVKDSFFLPIYFCGEQNLSKELDIESFTIEGYAIAYSDYARLRQMLLYKPVPLYENHYILHGYPQMKNAADKKELLPYTVNKTVLNLQAAYDEPLAQSGYIGTGYIIVLPDTFTEGLETAEYTLAINTKEKTSEEDSRYLTTLFEQDTATTETKNGETPSDWNVFDWNTKANALSISRAAIIIFGFGLYYTGLIFICTAATVLTVQQLSEAFKYRFRYKILSKLGVSDKKIGSLIFKQLLLYFLIPLLLPVPLAIFISFCVGNILFSMITPPIFITSVCMGLGLFLLIYVLYFAATYIGYRRSVL